MSTRAPAPSRELIDQPLPCTILDPGTLVHELSEGPPVNGTTVVVYSRGRVRLARVVKVTPTRVRVDYASPSAPGRSSAQPWFKRVDQISAPSPYPEHIILAAGAAPRPAYARTWRVAGGTGRGGHSLIPFEVDA